MTFQEIALECIKNKELVKEFNRLSGTHIGEDNRAPITKMIDESTGYQKELDKRSDEELKLFLKFVLQYIYSPCLMNYLEGEL